MNIETKMQAFEHKLIVMGKETYQAMELAMEAFTKQDRIMALDVIEKDDRINYAEEIINDEAIEILTLMQPVAKDLRLLIGGIKIANDLERIGDYAKNIGRFVIRSKFTEAMYQEEILELTKMFLNNFGQVLDVLSKRDVKEAYRVAALDDNLDDQFEEFVQTLTHGMDETMVYPVEIINIARNLERAGDHSKNICEQIIYTIKGNHIDFG